MDRTELLDRLKQLTETQFAELVFTLGVPRYYITTRAQHAHRVVELLEYLESNGRLDDVAAHLSRLAPAAAPVAERPRWRLLLAGAGAALLLGAGALVIMKVVGAASQAPAIVPGSQPSVSTAPPGTPATPPGEPATPPAPTPKPVEPATPTKQPTRAHPKVKRPAPPVDPSKCPRPSECLDDDSPAYWDAVAKEGVAACNAGDAQEARRKFVTLGTKVALQRQIQVACSVKGIDLR